MDIEDPVSSIKASAKIVLSTPVSSSPALPENAVSRSELSASIRKISVPMNRLTPLRKDWMELIAPLTTHMKLAVQFNTKSKRIFIAPAWLIAQASVGKGGDGESAVEPIPESSEIRAINGGLERAVEYVKAYLLGFAIHDAMALLRLDDIFLQSFRVTDVKRLVNDNMSRAIGRIAGKDGKTKNAIQNSTKTRLVISNKNIYLLGSYDNINLARDAICSLILGKSPGRVYNHLRIVSRRMKERGF